MFKPNGMSAKNSDPVVLMNIWAHHLEKRSTTQRKMIFAGMGKPGYILNEDIAHAAMNYWESSIDHIAHDRSVIDEHSKKAHATTYSLLSPIDYGLPGGDDKAKGLMAKALTNWYEIAIDPEEVIFSVGGIAALRMIFRMVHEQKAAGKIITPLPYYPFYNNPIHQNTLLCIDLLNEPGYRLTADALNRCLQRVTDMDTISAFLFCDPCNPLGFTVGREEWKKIAVILQSTPDNIPIIVDEAYAELVFASKHISLLTVAPELKKRLIVLRSATKGFSASGERMAIMLCFNESWREELLNETMLTYLHAPISTQAAYAHAMYEFTEEKRKNLSRYYETQVAFVKERLNTMRIALPDTHYIIDGTFYILADLSALLGEPIPTAAEQALGKKGRATTDVDICYSLLFEKQIMVCPLSFFGVDPQRGYVRITCSYGISVLKELLDRLA